MTRLSFILTIALLGLPVLGQAEDHVDSFDVVELNGQPFAAKATISLPVDGKIEGQGPCNRFFASVTGDLASLTIGPVAATKMACPDLGAEAALFGSLTEIIRIEVQSDGSVILFDDKAPRIVLQPAG